MSASLNPTAWCELICWPNELRSVVKRNDSSRQARASPTAIAEYGIRAQVSVPSASAMPRPS